MRSRLPLLSVALVLAFTAAGAAAGPAVGREHADAPAAQEPSAPSCQNSCRGLGIEKVKAGDEHCGLVPRERKDESLDAACGLAESHAEELEELAEERARDKCSAELDQAACACRTELRPWQNVYTHVLSQRCWTECGWAFLIECESSRPDTDN